MMQYYHDAYTHKIFLAQLFMFLKVQETRFIFSRATRVPHVRYRSIARSERNERFYHLIIALQ